MRRPERGLVWLTGLVWLVFSVPHLAYYAAHLKMYDIAVKARYRLPVDQREKAALTRLLRICPG